MTYASALPMAFNMLPTQRPFAALGGKTPLKLGDLIGQNRAAQVSKLGDLVPPHGANPLHTPAGVGPQVMGMIGQTLAGSTPGAGIGTDFDKPSATLADLDRKAMAGPTMSVGADSPLSLGNLPMSIEGAKLGDLMQPVDPSSWHTKKPKFFSKDGAGPIVLAALGDALQYWGSGGQQQGHGMQNLMDLREREEVREFDREKWSRELEAKREEARARRIEQVGNAIGWLDPEASTFSPIFTAPTAPESYASALGFQRGTPEYQQAVEDYRLGSWSEPAMENKTELEGVRYGNRRALQNDRLAVTRRGQDMRSSDTRRGQTLTDARGRRGQDMTDARVRQLHGKKVSGQSVSSSEPMTRLSNGSYAVVRGGRWVDANTGQPVQ